MALKLRPTGLGSGIDKDPQDYTVYTGGWDIGRIYEVRGGPDNWPWFWSFTLHGPTTRSDRVATSPEFASIASPPQTRTTRWDERFRSDGCPHPSASGWLRDRVPKDDYCMQRPA
jgi:hypothetical protein